MFRAMYSTSAGLWCCVPAVAAMQGRAVALCLQAPARLLGRERQRHGPAKLAARVVDVQGNCQRPALLHASQHAPCYPHLQPLGTAAARWNGQGAHMDTPRLHSMD